MGESDNRHLLTHGVHKGYAVSCLRIHYDGEGNVGPACVKCTYCHEWIRPENIEDICPERSTWKGELDRVNGGNPSR